MWPGKKVKIYFSKLGYVDSKWSKGKGIAACVAAMGHLICICKSERPSVCLSTDNLLFLSCLRANRVGTVVGGGDRP